MALEGTHQVTLHDGRTVTVEPVCAVLRRKLDAHYTPEKQQEITGVHPETIRMLARKMATKRTNIFLGMNACKMYHGDLIERTMCLVLAASGNWGRRGTGLRTWASGLHDGAQIAMNKRRPGLEASGAVMAGRDAAVAALKFADPSLVNDELAMYELTKGRRGLLGMMDERTGDDVPADANTPPVFWWYNQMDFRRPLEQTRVERQLHDPHLRRVHGGRGQGRLVGRPEPPAPGRDPPGLYRVWRQHFPEDARRQESPWPASGKKLKTVIAIDFKMTSTVQKADYFLPGSSALREDRVLHPRPICSQSHARRPGGATRPVSRKNEWDIFLAMLKAVD